MAEQLPTMHEIINGIAAKLPLLDKSDLSPFSAIMDELESVKKGRTLKKAFITLIDRTLTLIQNIIMGETDFNAGCKKLNESIGKMLKETGALDDTSTGSVQRGPTGRQDEESEPVEEMPDDLKEILVKFANNQQSVLEDFEAYILEMEKGIPQAKGAIKRIMHTWKGEFGVLDMSEYSKLIHTLEDMLEDGAIGAENLFKLKDFMAGRMDAFASGKRPPLGDDERESLCGNRAQEVEAGKRESGSENAGETAKQPEVNDAALTPVQPVPLAAAQRRYEGDPALVTDFINEAREHLHSAETLLLELEAAPSNADAINSVFRAWHTIKGVAGFLSLKEIQELSHSMESLMDKARKGDLQLNAEYIDLLLEGNDTLKTFVGFVEESMTSTTLKIPEQFSSLLARLRSPLALDNTGPVDMAATAKKIGEILVENGVAPEAAIEAALAKQKLGDNRKLGEILIDEQNLTAQAVGGALATQSAARAGTSIEETIRVPVNRIGQLVDTIGEAVIAQSMIYAHPSIRDLEDQTVHTKIAHAAMIMRSIQEMAMSLRMVSVKATFQKMARLARDLAKKMEREVDFITEGEDTELDKSVVENIGDPLIHMIRNAIDHGIESAEERAKSGKPARAEVRLKAYHRAGNIYIEVCDDGKGLDRDAIIAKAVSKGLCKPDERLSDEEAFRFIFLPGFSTAKVVTDVSGRGVGMDVVRRNIEALRGSCEISSTRGKGTVFTIRLPLTLAIVDGMIVRAGDENYIIPTLAIIESLRPASGQVETVMHKGAVVKVRGDLIPLVHLQSLFSKNGKGNVDYMTGVIMIVENMLGKKLGLHLDEIVGQQQVVIKSLGEGVGEVQGVTGGAIMSDGTVSLILDIGGIVKLANG
jgi:two-component system chemotaxis sensor kinase CheA